ncbi:family 16 glycosylhydrolase [Marivirga arenosa]|uniref:Family 16 glycosylhydrolase n=1 Tax=Marivirga arenosa TaxID=3059076 RepID=A0AA51N6I2_9BACT|nr:family 16 glycosylhydrolase [Marivirga sp. ABR2-2]WMN06928.1 family 16 glycosylhydrolase [Marivirga sp. ABR2-2]
MKRKKLIGSVAIVFLTTIVFFNCTSNDEPQPSEENENTINNVTEYDRITDGKDFSSWTEVFKDDFTDSISSSINWIFENNRADYNSTQTTDYRSSQVDYLEWDNREVITLSAVRRGSRFEAGHIKSIAQFGPEENQELSFKANLKLFAEDGQNPDGSPRYVDFDETYGLWPAFWTVDEDGWPTKGEIDIMEGYSYGDSETYASNIFYGPNIGVNSLSHDNTVHEYPLAENTTEGWHTLEMRWMNDGGEIYINIFVDGEFETTYDSDTDPNLDLQNFTPHNIIFNLNVGHDGAIFNNNLIDGFTKAYYLIDWVEVSKRNILTQ